MTATPTKQSDEQFLDALQRAAFCYFLKHFNPANGLIADKSFDGSPCSIAAVGFALSSYPIGVERGWMAREDAISRTLAALRFFWSSPQSDQPDATGYKGFYYHFLDMQTGARTWQSELSMVDSAFLIAGMLSAGAYFSGDTPTEKEIRDLADALYRRVDWRWAQDGGEDVRQGWKPDIGFLHYGWDGYNEASLVYILGMASPTHPLPRNSYDAWSAAYQWENIYDIDFLYAGPLFFHTFSHAWLDFKDIRDAFMREKNCDYFENTRRAAYVQREYARRNPFGFDGYNENCWGLTAGDGPGFDVRHINGRQRRIYGYVARGVPHGPDDGTIAPWSALATLPFAPEIALPAARHFFDHYPDIIQDGMLPSGFNPTLAADGKSAWVSAGFLGLEQGIVLLMIENYRSQLIWKLMRQCPYIANGLRCAGFEGGWL